MRIMTWNIDVKAMSRRRMKRILSVVEAEQPDVLMLQEVGVGWEEDLEHALPELGLRWVRYGRHRGDYLKYGNLTAVRTDASELAERLGLYPELLHVVHLGDLTLMNVHIPNGTGFGWEKIEQCRSLRSAVKRVDGRLIIGGDFNAPALETTAGAFTFGVEVLHEAKWKSMATAADHLSVAEVLNLPRRYWKDKLGSGEDWEKDESWIFNQSGECGLYDAYRSIHPVVDSVPCAFSFRFAHGGSDKVRRFDHLFLSRGLQAKSAEYRHGVMTNGISDHTPLCVEIN